MSPLSRRILLTLIVLLNLNGDLVSVPIAYRMKIGDGSGFGLGVLFGLLLGQIALVAAYSAWGRDLWLTRWVTSWLLVALLWYTVTVGAVGTGDSFEIGSIEQLLGVVVALPFVFISSLFSAMRAVAGSRFQTSVDAHRAAQSFSLGFRVRDVLTWTAATAVVLVILRSRVGRELWGSDWQIASGDWLAILLWMSLWSALCMLAAVPAMWACLGETRPIRRLPGVGAYVLVLSAAQWLIVRLVTGENLLGLVVVGLNVGVLFDVVPCGLLLRTGGYRLHLRVRRGPR